jgi:hypothetical protein
LLIFLHSYILNYWLWIDIYWFLLLDCFNRFILNYFRFFWLFYLRGINLLWFGKLCDWFRLLWFDWLIWIWYPLHFRKNFCKTLLPFYFIRWWIDLLEIVNALAFWLYTFLNMQSLDAIAALIARVEKCSILFVFCS